jgi:hypothetical protein
LSTSIALDNTLIHNSSGDLGQPIAGIAGGTDPDSWSSLQKAIVRIATIFFGLALFPLLTVQFWRDLGQTNWAYFQDVFRLTTVVPSYFSAPKWGFASFGTIYLILAISLIGGILWGYAERNDVDYKVRYYWLRVFLRYRLAIGLIAFGLLQVFPVQFPHATLSDMHTNYGDYLQWKLYYLTNSVAHAHYEQALGILEVVGGLLLLWRATVSLGAIISVSMLFNIVLANFAYQLGDHIYATLLLIAASFVMLYDAGRIINLFVLRRAARAERFRPDFSGWRAQRLHVAAKATVFACLLFFAGLVSYSYHHSNWPLPDATATLKGAAGYYNVREFEWNGKVLPYSLTDPNRWQDVVFEQWNTISIHSSKPVPIEVANPAIAYANEQRTYEYAGNGGRLFYGYTVDPAAQSIRLQGKNDPHEVLSLHYSYGDDGSLALVGNDQDGNKLRIVLDKVDKKYLLLLGRRNPLNVY